MKLEPDEIGFAKYKDSDCELVAVLGVDEDSYEMLTDQIDMTIDFNDYFLERLHEVLRENYDRVGCLVKIEVHPDKKGMGLGHQMMSCYEQDIGSQSDVDILFARITNPQEKGFSLRKFYQDRGFEPIKVDDGSLLMANKGQAKEIMRHLGLHRAIDASHGLSM